VTYDNIYAIGKTIDALRGIERWGTGDMVEQAFTGFVALPAPKSPHEVLGVKPGASLEEIEKAFRVLAKELHSDTGGNDAVMAELLEARRKLKERAT
jgi:DnaJ-domain-containing protein 1